jgi:large exoprotein involved in heme utilization and adhesion
LPDRTVSAESSEPVISEPIVEAQGWVTRANGSIALVAKQATPQLGFPLNCRKFRQSN